MVQRSVTVVRDGETTWPPPPVQVSAAPAAAAAPVEVKPAKRPMTTARRLGLTFTAAAVLFALIALSPAALQVHLTVFALAIVIGYYVIGNVHHALHTPLMSVTNAISGIIVVGALLQIGHGIAVVTVLATLAILLASINVFGGFAVTRRMLGDVLEELRRHVHTGNHRDRGLRRRGPAVHPRAGRTVQARDIQGR